MCPTNSATQICGNPLPRSADEPLYLCRATLEAITSHLIATNTVSPSHVVDFQSLLAATNLSAPYAAERDRVGGGDTPLADALGEEVGEQITFARASGLIREREWAVRQWRDEEAIKAQMVRLGYFDNDFDADEDGDVGGQRRGQEEEGRHDDNSIRPQPSHNSRGGEHDSTPRVRFASPVYPALPPRSDAGGASSVASLSPLLPRFNSNAVVAAPFERERRPVDVDDGARRYTPPPPPPPPDHSRIPGRQQPVAPELARGPAPPPPRDEVDDFEALMVRAARVVAGDGGEEDKKVEVGRLVAEAEKHRTDIRSGIWGWHRRE